MAGALRNGAAQASSDRSAQALEQKPGGHTNSRQEQGDLRALEAPENQPLQ